MTVKLFFPIETTARELDHKILMGVLACKRGRDVYIGDQQIIRELSFVSKKGVFYGKHLFGKPAFSDDTYYKRLKKNNFKLVHLNEEGAVWAGREKEWKAILRQCERPSKLNFDDYMATWGEWQKNYNESYEPTKANIVVTGHPKFDLYRKKYLPYYEDSIDLIKNKYGDFILVNTAFSLSNNGKGGNKFIFKKKKSYDPLNVEHRKYFFRDWRNQSISMSNMVFLINELSLFYPDKNIVLRPHPSENTQYYKDIFQGVDNVHVTYEGSVSSWILACDALIHNGCTTSIEASLAEKPVINYSSENDNEFEVFLASICGVRCNTPQQVIDNLSDLWNNNRWDHKYIPSSDLAHSLFKNFMDADCKDNVLYLIEQAEKGLNRESSKFDGLKFLLASKFHYLYLAFKFTYMYCIGNPENNKDYRKRFERFEKKDIEMKVESMSKIIGVNAKLKWCSKYMFVIENNDK